MRKNAVRRLKQLACLVPFVAALQQVGGHGVPLAEACSGSGPGPEPRWLNLSVADSYPLTQVAIATDGFVLLDGTFNRGEEQQELQLPWVRVTNDAGDEVPGQLQVLRSEPHGDYIQAYLSWHSDQALPIGTVLQLSSADNPNSAGEGGSSNATQDFGSITLEVVEEPTPLPTATVTLGAWLDVRHGVGDLVDCVSWNSCGNSTLQVPTREIRLPGVSVTWKLPGFSSMVAWEVRAEPSDPQNGVETGFSRSEVVGRKGAKAETVEVGPVTFADDASDYCVVVVVKDLRTGDESRSEPVCEAPGDAEYERADHELGLCEEPPTPESVPLWCLNHRFDEHCPDYPGEPGEGTGDHASGAQGGQPADAGGRTSSATQGGQPTDTDEPTDASRESASGGCQVTPAASGFGLAAAALGALLSFIARRRRAH